MLKCVKLYHLDKPIIVMIITHCFSIFKPFFKKLSLSSELRLKFSLGKSWFQTKYIISIFTFLATFLWLTLATLKPHCLTFAIWDIQPN